MERCEPSSSGKVGEIDKNRIQGTICGPANPRCGHTELAEQAMDVEHVTDPAEAEDPNKHIEDYLQYYCDPSHAFDYAVMLKGDWGSGKTFLINRFLAERAKSGAPKNLSVSLYGLTSFRQIDDALERQLHPVLSSKGMKIATTLARGALKGVFKIDLTGDGKDELTIDSHLPEFNILEYFKIPKECLIVFDDLERCSIPVPDVLGYINAFVEHEGFKVIIIANENEILKREIGRYPEIKEKLIGQTLEVRSTAKFAIQEFFTLIENQRTRIFLEKNVDTVLLLHSQTGKNNLRILKHALWDFERLATCFSVKHWENDEAVGIVFRVVLALSFQTRSGSLKEEQFAEFRLGRIRRYLGAKSGEAAGAADELLKLFPSVDFDQTIVSCDLLKAFFFDGWLSPAQIRGQLDQSPYFAAPGTQPEWKTAWYIWDADDDAYNKVVAKVEEQFKQRAFEAPGEILHVFDLRLLFCEIGTIAFSKLEVTEQCTRYIDDIQRNGKINSTYAARIDLDTKLNALIAKSVER